MWTLAQARERLGRRLAEVSTVFWDNTERNNAINDACRLIAGITKGVPKHVTGNVYTGVPKLTIVGSLVRGTPIRASYLGRAIPAVLMEVADVIYPDWRNAQGEEPRWAIIDVANSEIYFTPLSSTELPVEAWVSVLPAEVTVDSDELFDGQGSMEQYQTAMLNVAAAYCLLRERYDGDAERFWQFAQAELQQLGVNPNDLPSLRAVAA